MKTAGSIRSSSTESAIARAYGYSRGITFGVLDPGIMALRPGAKLADVVCPLLAGVLVRDAMMVPDLIGKRLEMAADASYHGMWVLRDREGG